MAMSTLCKCQPVYWTLLLSTVCPSVCPICRCFTRATCSIIQSQMCRILSSPNSSKIACTPPGDDATLFPRTPSEVCGLSNTANQIKKPRSCPVFHAIPNTRNSVLEIPVRYNSSRRKAMGQQPRGTTRSKRPRWGVVLGSWRPYWERSAFRHPLHYCLPRS